MKRIILAIAILGIALMGGNSPNPETLTIHDQAVMEWQLGDDITPYPQIGDCDDATLYDYLFLTNIERPVKIMYGKSFWIPNTYHVWVVSGNWTYDAGIALYNMNWKGREISYYQLLIYAAQDFQ